MDNVKILMVFLEGVLSVFSPCVLPILPVYISILANSSIDDIERENNERKVLIVNSLLFALGIGSTFFILGSSISALTQFFNDYKSWIMIIGGAAVFIMGAFYLDFIKINFMMREKRFNYKYRAMSPVSAFILGFFFSFGWTPCIGPILASVLVLASSTDNIYSANMLILFYTLGFVVPFLITAFFYNKLHEKLNFLKKHMDIIKRICGIIIVAAGVLLISDGMKNIAHDTKNRMESRQNEKAEYEQVEKEYNEQKRNGTYMGGVKNAGRSASDFILYDQNGVQHSLKEYRGKIVFLNFWATWCDPCRSEMPDVQEMYEKYGENKGDVIILGVSTPDLRGGDSKEEIIKYISENEYTFPTLIDEKYETMVSYEINAFPTTYLISRDGNIITSIPGALKNEDMVRMIDNAVENY